MIRASPRRGRRIFHRFELPSSSSFSSINQISIPWIRRHDEAGNGLAMVGHSQLAATNRYRQGFSLFCHDFVYQEWHFDKRPASPLSSPLKVCIIAPRSAP